MVLSSNVNAKIEQDDVINWYNFTWAHPLWIQISSTSPLKAFEEEIEPKYIVDIYYATLKWHFCQY